MYTWSVRFGSNPCSSMRNLRIFVCPSLAALWRQVWARLSKSNLEGPKMGTRYFTTSKWPPNTARCRAFSWSYTEEWNYVVFIHIDIYWNVPVIAIWIMDYEDCKAAIHDQVPSDLGRIRWITCWYNLIINQVFMIGKLASTNPMYLRIITFKDRASSVVISFALVTMPYTLSV